MGDDGKKPFISTVKWPEYDESKIDEKAEAEEQSILQLVSDINNVLKLAKVEKPSKITLFVAEKWKYDFFSKLKKSLEKTRNIGEIIKDCMDKTHQKEISSLVPKLVKNESRIPKVMIGQDEEINNLEKNKNLIEKHFNCSVEIIKADDSKQEKAKQAIPSKPAVLVN